ncbi:hypothetical protein BH160DRAFT_3013 [Burkholderia sp. H160]|nr:hypothetical protein BH160DRAFT_3013 [Burkholderia sp. H160]
MGRTKPLVKPSVPITTDSAKRRKGNDLAYQSRLAGIVPRRGST